MGVCERSEKKAIGRLLMLSAMPGKAIVGWMGIKLCQLIVRQTQP